MNFVIVKRATLIGFDIFLCDEKIRAYTTAGLNEVSGSFAYLKCALSVHITCMGTSKFHL